MVQLARQRLQFIAAVAVEQHQLPDPLALHGIDQVGQQMKQGGRRDAASQSAWH